MKLRLKKFDVAAGRPIVFMDHDDARKMDVNVGDRVEISCGGKKIIGRADIVEGYVKSGEILLSEDIVKFINLKPGVDVNVDLVSKPDSAEFIRKKMNDKELNKNEIFSIISDVVNNALTEAEIAQFVVAVYKNGMSHRETIDLTHAMCQTGTVLKWKSKIVADKHSIGGIAGNRTTPIIVSICAAAGIIMPKTSSRAITSAAGTADVIETMAKVDFPAKELQRIVSKVGACLAWGGSLGLAPADDKLI
ncbi:MAG: thymidine phosphorylase, partial [Nanoarchaeota archaeon]